MDIERLKFRRQYLLSPNAVQCPFLHNFRKISDKYHLYTHIDLNVTEYSRYDRKLILLGDIFDYESPGKSNSDILHDLIHLEFDKLLEAASRYCGRFIIIFSRVGRIMLFHDATATRKIYFCSENGELWFASQPHLLSTVLGLKGTMDASKDAYYHSGDLVKNFCGNIGNTTYYDEISQVLPNHYISAETGKVTRYWPNRMIQAGTLKTAAANSARMIKGFVEAIASRYDVMLPVTAGKDSRTILAASRDIKERIFIYSNRMMQMNKQDILIPKKLLTGLSLNFNLIDPYLVIDEEFRNVYFQNNPFASEQYLPLIYNYHVNYSNKVNMPGNSVAGQEYIYNIVRRRLTADDIVSLSGLRKYKFAAEYFIWWYNDAYEKCLQFRVNPMSLFYWENRLTNFIQQIQLDKDIAQEEFSPFNSRELMIYYLSVKPKHNVSPDYRLHREVMKKLWPVVLDVPINPSTSSSLKSFMKTLGLLSTYYTLKHSFSRAS